MSEAPVHLVLLLGASEFPALPKLGSARAFRNSAEDIAAYFTAQSGPGVYHVKDLFDAEECVVTQGFAIGDFLKKHEATATDLIIYYIGHGGFLSQREYYLTLRSTRAGYEGLSGLRVSALAEVVKQHFIKRVYVILDCCFAGEAFRDFQSDALSSLIEKKTFGEFSSSGTALLAASSKDDVALSPKGARYTMFSGAMLEVLRSGIENMGPLLSLEMVADRIRQIINDQHGGDGTLPEVHSPKQEAGQPIARYKLFRNAAYAEAELPDEYVKAMGVPLPRARAAGVETLEALLLAGSQNGFAAVGVSELRRVAKTDDSKLVRECAERALAALAALGVGDVAVEETPTARQDRETRPEAEPSLVVVVRPSKRRIAPNSQVIWTVVVTNDGQEPMRAIEVTDAAGGPLCEPFDLAPAEERRIKFRNHYTDRGSKMKIAVMGRTDDNRLVDVEGVGRVSVRQPKAPPTPAAKSKTAATTTPLLRSWEDAMRRTPTPPAALLGPGVPSKAAALDLTQFRTALRQVKHTAKLGDATVNRLIRLIGEGEHHYRIATGRTGRPGDWSRRVVDWAAEVASARTGDVIMVRLNPPSPAEIVENIDRLAAEVAVATAVRIPTDEFPKAPARSVNDAL